MTARRKVVTALAILSPLCLVLALMLRPRTAREPVPAAGFSGSSSSGAGVAHEIASLQAALDRKPKHMPILLRMAELERSERRLTEAVAHLREAVKAEPGSVDANLELGRALFETGDTLGALSATKRVLEEDQNQVDALYNLGAIYANLGNDAWARTYFGRAVETGPSTESGRKAKAALLQLAAAPPLPIRSQPNASPDRPRLTLNDPAVQEK